jgi:hypothetical protein
MAGLVPAIHGLLSFEANPSPSSSGLSRRSMPFRFGGDVVWSEGRDAAIAEGGAGANNKKSVDGRHKAGHDD